MLHPRRVHVHGGATTSQVRRRRPQSTNGTSIQRSHSKDYNCKVDLGSGHDPVQLWINLWPSNSSTLRRRNTSDVWLLRPDLSTFIFHTVHDPIQRVIGGIAGQPFLEDTGRTEDGGTTRYRLWRNPKTLMGLQISKAGVATDEAKCVTR